MFKANWPLTACTQYTHISNLAQKEYMTVYCNFFKHLFMLHTIAFLWWSSGLKHVAVSINLRFVTWWLCCNAHCFLPTTARNELRLYAWSLSHVTEDVTSIAHLNQLFVNVTRWYSNAEYMCNIYYVLL